jgi:hypothetical protein
VNQDLSEKNVSGHELIEVQNTKGLNGRDMFFERNNVLVTLNSRADPVFTLELETYRTLYCPRKPTRLITRTK